MECSNCGSSIAAARYAPHLEKCLGRGGRHSSRAASARLRAAAYSESDHSEGEDLDEAPGRKKHRGGSAPPSRAGSMKLSRSVSPPPSVPESNGPSLGSRAGLPPSGRGRVPAHR
eukprot:CAMPEP_0198326198 /NCGR_PEP_ID=MMETSP1450-20131203/13793_1 /TAXON_ID=753684 ORGANISM="Madagascaria erythrocladiodes, Strain CCMP3234" /NCGR_SAMPLE_ID=MMETSP1450 /ASSEMBLY_ACC=CAM_ASM_001115 /LENGTH=114 /DNA_ID=CAMNT_0044030147 /DNA_START=24 /DNA_END=368 /DNA_ORIENTATION=-